jgi:hypothetical protein
VEHLLQAALRPWHAIRRDQPLRDWPPGAERGGATAGAPPAPNAAGAGDLAGLSPWSLNRDLARLKADAADADSNAWGAGDDGVTEGLQQLMDRLAAAAAGAAPEDDRTPRGGGGEFAGGAGGEPQRALLSWGRPRRVKALVPSAAKGDRFGGFPYGFSTPEQRAQEALDALEEEEAAEAAAGLQAPPALRLKVLGAAGGGGDEGDGEEEGGDCGFRKALGMEAFAAASLAQAAACVKHVIAGVAESRHEGRLRRELAVTHT